MELFINDYSRYRDLFILIDSEGREYFNFYNDINLETTQPVEYILPRDIDIFRLAGNLYFNRSFNGSQLWWAIADINNIIDPLEMLEGGTKLLIPQVESIKQIDRINDLFGVV